jgi:hypothetical protein
MEQINALREMAFNVSDTGPLQAIEGQHGATALTVGTESAPSGPAAPDLCPGKHVLQSPYLAETGCLYLSSCPFFPNLARHMGQRPSIATFASACRLGRRHDR